MKKLLTVLLALSISQISFANQETSLQLWNISSTVITADTIEDAPEFMDLIQSPASWSYTGEADDAIKLLQEYVDQSDMRELISISTETVESTQTIAVTFQMSFYIPETRYLVIKKLSTRFN